MFGRSGSYQLHLWVVLGCTSSIRQEDIGDDKTLKRTSAKFNAKFSQINGVLQGKNKKLKIGFFSKLEVKRGANKVSKGDFNLFGPILPAPIN